MVPMLRCHLHDPILNLSYSGEVYETALFWESDTNTLAIMARVGSGPGAREGQKLRLTTVDAANGEPVLERAWRKEDLYQGEALAQAPELLLVPRGGYMTLGATDFPAGRVVTPAFAGSGWHEPLGILVGAGEGIGHGEVAGARLVDMLPTVLYAMDLAVPAGLDGRVVEDLFDPDYRATHPVRFQSPQGEAGPGVEGLEGEEWDAQLRRRLRGLGYL